MRTVKVGPTYGRYQGAEYNVIVIRVSDEDFEDYYSFDYHVPKMTIPLLCSAYERVYTHTRRTQALDDGTRMSGYVWVRVQLEHDSSGVHSYTLFANGMSPQESLVSEIIGAEHVKGAPLEDIPQCIADPVRMMLIRNRSTETAMIAGGGTFWFYELPLTTHDLMEITRRDKWAFEGRGRAVFKDLMGVLSAQESTEVSA